MTKDRRVGLGLCFGIAMSVGVLIVAGCSKPQDTASNPAEPAPGAAMGGGPGGPGGMPGGGPGGGRRGGPVAENASGAEIYQAKCGCHGQEGKGGRAPVLTKGAGRSEADLVKIIHDGHERMPAFANQLTAAQINKVAAYVKQL